MADHLRLPRPTPTSSKRVSVRFNPDPPPFDRRGHATTLRGILEGLESAAAGVFDSPAPVDDQGEIDAAEFGEVVLKFTGRAAFNTGPFGSWNLQSLAITEGNEFFALSNADARRAFREITRRYDADPDEFTEKKTWIAALDNIVGVELYGREDRLEEGLEPPVGGAVVAVNVILWPTSYATRNVAREARRRVAAVVEMIQRFAADDDRVAVLASDDIHSDTLMVYAQLNAAAFEAVAEHPYVVNVRGPLTVELRQEDLSAGSPPNESPLPEGQPIGIIDDLVSEDNPWMEDVVVERRDFGSFGQATTHGTQVASIAAWGDVRQLLNPAYDGQPFPIYSARVAQMNTVMDPQVVGNPSQQVAAAMDWLASRDVRIVVFAFTESRPDNGALPSEISATIDERARANGQVVIVPAGNLARPSGGAEWIEYPAYLGHEDSKVAAPGSAALALTVGSVAHSEQHDVSRWPSGVKLAGTEELSPFTRTGPSRGTGVRGRQKPEFSAYGGNWAWDSAGRVPITGDANLNVTTLIPSVNGRLFASAYGTSYAAPLVAHEVAAIASRYPKAGANLLHALTAVAGDHPEHRIESHLRPVRGTYGIPRAETVLESNESRAILVYEGDIATNSHAVIEIPIPEEFATGRFAQELRVALAFDPPVRRSRRDYIAGHMEFELVHRTDLETIKSAYSRQPTAAERKKDPSKVAIDRPGHMSLRPARTDLHSDTLICRSFRQPGSWNPDDKNYHLVITHEHSPWTQAQKRNYDTQTFAVVVEVADLTRPQLDLHALFEAQLELRARGRGNT